MRNSKPMTIEKIHSSALVGLMLALTSFGLQPLHGQQAKPTAAAPAARPVAVMARHCLWRIQNQQNIVYLLGSIHVLKESDYPLAPLMESAFTNARIAVFETDIDALDNPDVLLKIAMKGRLPEGQTLKTQLTPATYAALSSHIQKAGLPADV